MSTFLFTAYRYMAGQSGRPSSLPARESVNLAKEKSRKVRLFCKGLENFCQILYKEPDGESSGSAAVTREGIPDLTSSVTATVVDQQPIKSASVQNQNLPSGINTVAKTIDNKEPAFPAVDSRDQQSLDSTDDVSEMIADRRPHQYVLTQGEDMFKSLFADKKTPPNSPGSVASSGTLIDPSSRKVSPLDLGTISKGSPIAVKDFAYSSPDAIRVDPVTKIEEETKKGLLKQLKNKTAAEEKASRASEKLAATNKTLGAELKSTKAAVQDREAQADLAKVHANAMTVSNVVLRQIMKDICHGISHGNNGRQAQRTSSEKESESDQQKDESLQKHLRDVDESSASAYARMARLENASAVRDQDTNNTFGQESIQQENPSPIQNVVESKDSGPVAIQHPSRQTSEEAQTDVVEASSSTDISDEAQPKTFFEKYGFDAANLSRIFNSVTHTAQEEFTKKDTEDLTEEEGALQEVEEHKVETMADEADMTTLQEYQRQDLNLDEESATGQCQTMADPIGSNFEDAKPDRDYSSEANGKDQVSEVGDGTSPSAAEDPISASYRNEDPANTEPTTSTMPDQDYNTAMGSAHDGVFAESYEFSEPAGPATLWGILRSNQIENKASANTDAGDDSIGGDDATSDDAAGEDATRGDATCENATPEDATREDATREDVNGDGAADVLERPGPATLGEFLQSNQDKHSAEDNADGGEATAGIPEAADLSVKSSMTDTNNNADAGEETAITPEAAGPALLCGILRSKQAKEAEHQEVAGEKAPNNPEAGAPASPCEVLQSEQNENEVETQDAADDEAAEAAGASHEDLPGPATLWGILKSEHNTSIDHLREIEGSENGRMDGDEVLGGSASTDVAGAQDEDSTEPLSLPHNTPSPDYGTNIHNMHDSNDNEEDPSTPTGNLTVEEDVIANPHGPVDSGDVTVPDDDTEEVIAEEAVAAIGANSSAVTAETVADSVGGSKVFEESEHKLEIETTENIHLHKTTTAVDADTPVGTVEARKEDAGDATVAQKGDQEERAAEANTSEVTGTSEQLEENDEREYARLAEDEAVTGTSPLPAATAQDIEDPHEGKTLDASTGASDMRAACKDTDDHELQSVATEASSTTTAEGFNANSAAVPVEAPSSPSYPRGSPEFQVEEFDFNAPVPKVKRVKDPEKRKLDRARAKAKVKAEKAKAKEEEALRRQMEEEAKNTPEALAQREAEETKALGDKRLKLQEAREKKWLEARLPEE